MKSVFLSIYLVAFVAVVNANSLRAKDSAYVKPQVAVQKAKPNAFTKPSSNEASDSLQTQIGNKRRLIVYYFHGTQRCSNCIKIESYAKEIVDSVFSTQLKDSTIVWRLVNTDEDTNKHFRDDYQLYTKSVVLSDLESGKQVRWKNLDKIWEYLEDKTAFQTYIREEVAAYLKVE